MALAFPYVYIACPCSDASQRVLTSKRASRDIDLEEEIDEEGKSFDPRSPRSAYALFPPEHLLYCEECHDIKCPRCVTEEIICWYCPSCLFETPSSTVRSEGNRCARNCFNCPICQSQMITAPVGDTRDGPCILSCNYCMWSTLDIGITFDKPTGIRAQLDRLAYGGRPKAPSRVDSLDAMRKSSLAKEPFSPQDETQNPLDKGDDSTSPPLDPAARFQALRTFYKDQITASSTTESGLPTSGLDLYSSPSSLARIMSLYSNTSSATKKSRTKPQSMREALTTSEGLLLPNPSSTYQPQPFIDTPSLSQLHHQHPSYLGNPSATSVSDLRPMPTLLRTKRSKRCATCKHILVKPEFKPTSTRYRIKLLALNYIPFITFKPLPVPGGLKPSGPDGADVVLEPGKAVQFILTMRNPLYEPVKVVLGAEGKVPGKAGHRVTILCPEFEIGRNGDVWDDALDLDRSLGKEGGGEGVAGKVYEKGRNWVSVVVEIVPGVIDLMMEGEEGLRGEKRELEQDEDVIEVPIRVRLEWKEEVDKDRVKKGSERLKDGEEGGDVDDGRREIGYWMVLGVGRVKT